MNTEGAVEQELSGWGISPATPADRGLGMLSRSASIGPWEGNGGGQRVLGSSRFPNAAVAA